jgi:hypothetical protein
MLTLHPLQSVKLSSSRVLEFQAEKSERDILADYVDLVKFKDFHQQKK